MIEAPIPISIGPIISGPGGGSGISCVFESSLGQRAFTRIAKDSKEQAVKAIALDAATARSEINLEISLTHFVIKRARYIDKLTGKRVEEKTLVAPDFGNSTIQDVTDAGEHATGTLDGWKRTDQWARKFAKVEGPASLFAVLPGDEKKGDTVPHRAILWIKDETENVRAYFYPLPGSRETLSQMMEQLGYDGKNQVQPLEEQVIVKEGSSPFITHQEVIAALDSSLKDEVRSLSFSVLQNLKKEAEFSDDIRNERLQRYQTMYEEELKKARCDIEGALKSMAYGFVAIPQSIETFSKKDKPTSKESVQLLVSETSLTGYNDSGRGNNDGSPVRKIGNVVIHEARRDIVELNKLLVKQIIRPIVPIVVALISQIAETPVSSLSSRLSIKYAPISRSEFSTEPSITENSQSSPPQRVAPEAATSESKAQETWQLIISRILIPIQSFSPIDGVNSTPAEVVQDSQESTFTEQKGNLFLGKPNMFDIYAEFFKLQLPGIAEEIKERRNTIFDDKERRITVTSLQNVLEFIVNFNLEKTTSVIDASDEVDLTKSQILEEETVSIGKKLVEAFLADKLSLHEPFLKLFFLLTLYSDGGTKQESRHILGALIYREITQIQNNKRLIKDSPKLTSLLGKVSNLQSHAAILKATVQNLMGKVASLFQTDIFNKSLLDQSGGKIYRDIFLPVYFLFGPETLKLSGGCPWLKSALYSFEKLPSLLGMGRKLVSFAQFKQKKGNKIFPRFGLIYQLDFGVTCQYTTCYQGTKYDTI